MATSNRDRIGRMFELLSPALDAFISETLSPAIGDSDWAGTDQARLVILHPKFSHKRRATDSAAFTFAQQATERRGTANRTNHNMVVFLAPDEDRLAELDQAARTYLAWKEIVEKSNELNLTPQQLAQASAKRDQASHTIDDRLPLRYQWVLNPTSPVSGGPFEIEEIKTDGQSPSLADRVAKKMGSAGAFSSQLAARSTLRDRSAFRSTRKYQLRG